jgi:TnpA family transposase
VILFDNIVQVGASAQGPRRTATNIQPEIHSTDTHRANEINFALLHLFGYQFAPRYKDLFDKVRTCLCGFKHPNQYGDAILMPVRKAQKELIINEWDNVQRIIVSLALKATTQRDVLQLCSRAEDRGR